MQSNKKLLFEISKLKMQISILRLQNDTLMRSNAVSRDAYYEEVINGMQLKIEELMDERESNST